MGSIRTASASGAGTLGNKLQPKSNVPVPIYEATAEFISGTEAAPLSVIAVARRDEVAKENMLKAGPWTTVTNHSKVSVAHRYPTITSKLFFFFCCQCK